MSKTIYDEAILELEYLNTDMHDVMEDYIENYNHALICKALKQAQKQEKLLELNKKLNNIYEKLYNMELSDLCLNSNYYNLEIKKLKQQIKELENEQ